MLVFVVMLRSRPRTGDGGGAASVFVRRVHGVSGGLDVRAALPLVPHPVGRLVAHPRHHVLVRRLRRRALLPRPTTRESLHLTFQSLLLLLLLLLAAAAPRVVTVTTKLSPRASISVAARWTRTHSILTRGRHCGPSCGHPLRNEAAPHQIPMTRFWP